MTCDCSSMSVVTLPASILNNPDNPLRPAIDEGDALRRLFADIRREVKNQGCTRAVLVGHNAFFDLQFLNAAVERTGIKRNPFHPFSSFDTATLGGVALGAGLDPEVVVAAGEPGQPVHRGDLLCLCRGGQIDRERHAAAAAVRVVLITVQITAEFLHALYLLHGDNP